MTLALKEVRSTRKGVVDSFSRSLLVMTMMLIGITGCAGEQPDNLGASDGALAPCPSTPNCVSSQASDERHLIAPFEISGDPDEAFARLQGVLADRSDARVLDEQPGYLRVELRTALFVDDGEFLLDRAQNVIHVRSASRLGYSDLGKNRSRLEEIRRQYLSN